MNKEFLTINEFAACIGKSRSWIYSKIGTGEIPQPIVIGKTKRWDRKIVERWLTGLSKIGQRNKRNKELKKIGKKDYELR